MKKPYFPMFVDLAGKQIKVIGGGKIALRRVKTLLCFGADICVIAPKIREEFYSLESEGTLTFFEREYEKNDIQGADLVISASNGKEVNRCVYEACKEAGILVNTVDDRRLCDFYFPSVVVTEDLVIGMNSMEHDPKKVKEARSVIETMFENERDYRSE